MLRLIKGFMKGLGTLAKPWWAWLMLLVSVNMVGSLIFIGTPEGKVVFAAILFIAVSQLVIFRFLGYVRLLGITHIAAWIPMIPWLVSRLAEIGIDNPLGYWLLAVIVLDSISLVIDAVDVLRYVLGDRTPTVTTI